MQLLTTLTVALVVPNVPVATTPPNPRLPAIKCRVDCKAERSFFSTMYKYEWTDCSSTLKGWTTYAMDAACYGEERDKTDHKPRVKPKKNSLEITDEVYKAHVGGSLTYLCPGGNKTAEIREALRKYSLQGDYKGCGI